MRMNNTAERKTKSRAEREADLRAARRAEQATIVAGLQTALEVDEQLLGFARGRIAGGFRGKLNIGPEAFFAPVVNIGLTERRLVLQHIHPETGRPSEMLPHFYLLGDIASLAFSDIETYGGEPACRLVVHMTNDLYCRLRLRGQTNFESAQSIAEVFTSLTGPRRSGTTPTQRVCSQCTRMLDQPYKFCPYCGQQQPLETHASEPTAEPQSVAVPTPLAENAQSEPVEQEHAEFQPQVQQPEFQSEAWSESRTEAQPEAWSEAQSETSLEPRTETQPEAWSESRTEARSHAEPLAEEEASPQGHGETPDAPEATKMQGTTVDESPVSANE